MARQQDDRYDPLPNFLLLPVRAWRALGRRGRALAAVVAVALAALAVALVPAAVETGSENRANERRQRAADREQIRRTLIADQRPRRARLPRTALGSPERMAAATAPLVAADARKRAAAGDLDGPIGRSACQPVDGRGTTARAVVLSCVVERGRGRGTYRGRDLLVGYRFRARVTRTTGAVAWCKENPRPLHPDQEEFVTVPLSRDCTG
jgi:hypothetical protein